MTQQAKGWVKPRASSIIWRVKPQIMFFVMQYAADLTKVSFTFKIPYSFPNSLNKISFTPKRKVSSCSANFHKTHHFQLHYMQISHTEFYQIWIINVEIIFVVPSIMLYSSEIIPTRCNNCIYSSQWLYSTCFG